jgi:uncharacterized alkaline shock family protein YloU
MDAREFKSAEGSCIISEDVVASIVATAALETEGVAGLSGRATDIRGIISRNDAARAVRVINTENDTILDVYVTLKAGARIQETAMALQQNIKTAVQSMTGKPVTRINVHVDGIVADENKA